MLKLSPHDTAFPPGALVLVTGATGFMASHIVDQLLLAGYHVRGTVRDEKKAEWTTSFFSARHGAGKYSAVIVPEMSMNGAFDEVVKGVQGVIHTASNVSFSPDPNEVVTPTVAAVRALLESAAKEPSIKSFVYTSSSTAASAADQPLVLDDSTWNDAHIKEAWSVTSAPFPAMHANAVYSASKAEGEMAFWKFIEEQKPQFRANTILPDATLGEILSTQGSMSTGAWIRAVYESGVDFVKQLPAAWYVNVRDVGRLHVAALVFESVRNERIYAAAAPFSWNQVLAILRRLYPSKKIADDIEGSKLSIMVYPTTRGEQLLQDVFGLKGWVSLEQTVKENIKNLA